MNLSMEHPQATTVQRGLFVACARATGVVAISTVGLNLLLFGAARGLWGVPGTFAMFNPFSIAVSTLLGVVLGGFGLWLLARWTGRGRQVFTVLAGAIALLSLAGPYQAVTGAIPGMHAADASTGVTMVVLHIMTGVMIAWVLPALALRRNS
jgi:hypothetical protein